MTDHPITRMRHEIRRRQLTVQQVVRLTPSMLRITLEGDALAGFFSAAPDDHIKLFVPGTTREAALRDYTPRRYDAAANTLAIDFALHDAGPATQWALHAKTGDAVEIAGPRGSTLVPQSFDWVLLIGDETALPAIGRWVEEAPAGAKILSLAAVTGAADEQRFETVAAHVGHWVHRPAWQADDPAPVLAALGEIQLPAGDGFIWVAAEARVAKAVRQHFEVTRGHPKQWIKASGYWLKGVADAHERLDG